MTTTPDWKPLHAALSAPFPEGAVKAKRQCSIEGCENRHYGRGLCNKHWQRVRHHGDPFCVLRAPKGSGWITANGYRQIQINGRKRQVHDLVMEATLGRPLAPGEEVHHRNGDKLDNQIENLVLTTHSEHPRLHATWRNDTHKECSCCHVVKPRTEFSPLRKPGSDSNMSWCRACAAANMRERRSRR